MIIKRVIKEYGKYPFTVKFLKSEQNLHINYKITMGKYVCMWTKTT